MLYYREKIPDQSFNKTILIDQNELSLTAKLTGQFAIAVQSDDLAITPFHHLQVPESKRGHPYMTDLLVSSYTDELNSKNSILIKRIKRLLMVIEVKKSVGLDFEMLDASHIIEMLLYVKYMLMQFHQKEVIGSITDGSIMHCINFAVAESGLLIMKDCVHLKNEIANSIRPVLNHFGY